MYLIVTTVMISKDGAVFIQLAQQITSKPFEVIKIRPIGYPFLILVAQKCVALFTNNSSVLTWIYSAQSITLLCRLLALIPLYFIGKLLVGGKNSFWGLLILILLPYPAQFVCDVVREWPYLLFLATGFFFLLWGAKYGRWWAFGIAGLNSGLGYLIRPEGAQLVVYGFLWIATSMFMPKLWNVSRWKIIFALVLLLIGFAIPAAPHMKYNDKIIPSKLNNIIKSFSFNASPEKVDTPTISSFSPDYNLAEIAPSNVSKAFGKLAQQISENLMHFFVLPLVIGFFSYYRKLQKFLFAERFFIFALVVLNVVMMVLLYVNYGFIGRRHCLPIVVFTIFYIPVGMEIMACWLSVKGLKTRLTIRKDRRRWFFILIAVGLAICVGKLTRISHLRWEKENYLEAAQWLKNNTSEKDKIAVFDKRIELYSTKNCRIIENDKFPEDVDYAVKQFEDGMAIPESWNVQKEFTKGKSKVVIYTTPD